MGQGPPRFIYGRIVSNWTLDDNGPDLERHRPPEHHGHAVSADHRCERPPPKAASRRRRPKAWSKRATQSGEVLSNSTRHLRVQIGSCEAGVDDVESKFRMSSFRADAVRCSVGFASP